MAASLSSMTTTINPTTLEQNNIQSNELSAAALQSVTTTSSSPSTDGSSSVSDSSSQTTNSPSSTPNLISSNDQQQKDVEIVNEDSNSTDGSEDDEDQNNSLAAIAEQLNSNYGGFGTRNNRLVQKSNSTSISAKTSNSVDTKGSSGSVNNLMLNNLVANTKSRAVVSVQPLNLKTSAFVVEDSQSTTTNNNDNEGLIEVKDDKSSKQQQTIKQETDNEQPVTDNSLSPNNNNDDEEFTLISNNDQTDNQNNGRLNQGVLIHRTSGGKAIKFSIHNGTHSALKNSDTEVADDYEDGFEDVNEVEIIDTSKPNQAAVFAGNGSPLIIRPFPLSATCACAPLTTINNILYSGTSSQNVGKRLRILSKELGIYK